jgi:hypothetical protein
MFIENSEYEILTPSGWQDFRGITKTENKLVYRIVLNTGNYVDATANHYFFSNNNKIKLQDLKCGDVIDTINGSSIITEIQEQNNTAVYDIIEVKDKNHQFIVNNCFITKNCDELSFVNPSIANEFWVSISPTLSTGGKAIITSTPNSDEDQFALIWTEANKKFDTYGNEQELGVNGFYAFRAYWQEHPDRDENWKREELGRIGESRFLREFECQFISFEETLINAVKLAELKGIDPLQKMGNVRWYKPIRYDATYLIALDPSTGTGSDNAAIQVFSLPGFEQVAEWHHNSTPIAQQIKILRDIANFIKSHNDPQIYWSIENNSIGEACLTTIKEVGEDTIPGFFLSEPIRKGHVRRFRKGFNTTYKSKMTACMKFKSLIETEKMKIYSKPLISELKTFISSGAGFSAKAGGDDDLVSATLLVCRMASVLADWDSSIYEELTERVEEEQMPMPIFITNYF